METTEAPTTSQTPIQSSKFLSDVFFHFKKNPILAGNISID